MGKYGCQSIGLKPNSFNSNKELPPIYILESSEFVKY